MIFHSSFLANKIIKVWVKLFPSFNNSAFLPSIRPIQSLMSPNKYYLKTLSDLPLNDQRIPKYQPSPADKFKSFESARNVMKTLSDYTDCISEFMPLQDEQPFWLRSNHKNSNCSSQLCVNSNFYESYKKTNNFQLYESYCSCNVDECLGHEQIHVQKHVANS